MDLTDVAPEGSLKKLQNGLRVSDSVADQEQVGRRTKWEKYALRLNSTNDNVPHMKDKKEERKREKKWKKKWVLPGCCAILRQSAEACACGAAYLHKHGGSTFWRRDQQVTIRIL